MLHMPASPASCVHPAMLHRFIPRIMIPAPLGGLASVPALS
ncbi:hypothetical protein BIFBRE_04193 [Bifidobacterium breve DSM 20213 = JCM 1192]|uniref:Uncharacterized protein n=1 Tax=Bifidobacterium breve DSM 20213 = JCM 1192 TaxID=518634 RepID=D4BQ39_BIFBR|nr:hypothetical protein BIFBRE_04193 [Bifidobacterium breve DSM 20213 = JCM 1192]